MNKIEIEIDGMKCGMCEAHVNDLFRKNIKIKKIKSSHFSRKTIIFSDQDVSDEFIINILKNSGYKITSIKRTLAKKTIFGYK